jgi:hypothetical protein
MPDRDHARNFSASSGALLLRALIAPVLALLVREMMDLRLRLSLELPAGLAAARRARRCAAIGQLQPLSSAIVPYQQFRPSFSLLP